MVNAQDNNKNSDIWHEIKIYQVAKDKLFLILCSLTIIIDLLYPLTFTWDSGHYFSYLKVLNGELSWTNWDPARGIIFPLYLKLTTDLMGKTSNSLLIPMLFLHIMLFLIIFYLLIKATNVVSIIKQRWLLFLVFIFIVIDPLVLGFYHAILTESIASFIAILSCFFAYLLFKRAEKENNFFIFFIIFSFLVPLAWHLKQPYFGAALFPLLLASFLVMINSKKKSIFLQLIGGNILVIFMLGTSIFAWDQALPKTGIAANEDRKINSLANVMYINNFKLISQSPVLFLRNYKNNYLALANIYYYNIEKTVKGNSVFSPSLTIYKDFSIMRANENNAIGYRMYYLYGESNIFPMPETYLNEISSYQTPYYPPVYLNTVLKFTVIKSTISFSILYLVLPFSFIITFFIVIFKKRKNDRLIIIFLCSGSALLNALEHALINNPIDRYLFWGYPLLLLCFLLFFFFLFEFIKNSLTFMRPKS